MTGEELRDLVARYERRLKALPAPRPTAEVIRVEGAEVEFNRLGAVRVIPDTTQRVDLFWRERAPVVEFDVRVPGWSRITIESSPARLVQLFSRPVESGLPSRPLQTTHVVEPRGDRLLVRLACGSTPFVVHFKQWVEERVEPKEYEVPPCATAIRGEGTLVYATGQEVEVDGEQLLLRPDETGGLSTRPGGAYCTFIGESPAYVRIGTLWQRVLVS